MERVSILCRESRLDVGRAMVQNDAVVVAHLQLVVPHFDSLCLVTLWSLVVTLVPLSTTLVSLSTTCCHFSLSLSRQCKSRHLFLLPCWFIHCFSCPATLSITICQLLSGVSCCQLSRMVKTSVDLSSAGLPHISWQMLTEADRWRLPVSHHQSQGSHKCLSAK